MSLQSKLERAAEMCRARGLNVVRGLFNSPRVETSGGWINPVLCLTDEEYHALYHEPTSENTPNVCEG